MPGTRDNDQKLLGAYYRVQLKACLNVQSIDNISSATMLSMFIGGQLTPSATILRTKRILQSNNPDLRADPVDELNYEAAVGGLHSSIT